MVHLSEYLDYLSEISRSVDPLIHVLSTVTLSLMLWIVSSIEIPSHCHCGAIRDKYCLQRSTSTIDHPLLYQVYRVAQKVFIKIRLGHCVRFELVAKNFRWKRKLNNDWRGNWQ